MPLAELAKNTPSGCPFLVTTTAPSSWSDFQTAAGFAAISREAIIFLLNSLLNNYWA